MKESNFKPANQGQVDAIAAGHRFLNSGDPDKWFTLMGKAGTGKTTILEEIIAPHVKNGTVMIAALSHKAKLVLLKKLKDRFAIWTPEDHTIASLLEMQMDEETGKFHLPKNHLWGKRAPVTKANIIVVDEGSMVNENGLAHLMEEKRSDCRVIFAGDIGQLPPIREGWSPDADKDSPVFDTEYTANLTERIRQGEESPILPFADYYWNNSRSSWPVEYPVKERRSIVTPQGSLTFSSGQNAFNYVLPLYREAVDQKNPDLVRIIAYQNKTRKGSNNKIRRFLFDSQAVDEYVPGEWIIFMDNYEIAEEKISNSTEAQVTEAEPETTGDGWQCWKLKMAINGIPRKFYVLSAYELPRWNAHLNGLAEAAQKMQPGEQRKNAWAKFWGTKKRFAPSNMLMRLHLTKRKGPLTMFL